MIRLVQAQCICKPKDIQPKLLDTQVPYREIRCNYALSNSLSYITWVLIQGFKNKEESKTFLLESLKSERKFQGLEKIKNLEVIQNSEKQVRKVTKVDFKNIS